MATRNKNRSSSRTDFSKLENHFFSTYCFQSRVASVSGSGEGPQVGLFGTFSPTTLGDSVLVSWTREMEGVLNDSVKFETMNELLCMILKDERSIDFLNQKMLFLLKGGAEEQG